MIDFTLADLMGGEPVTDTKMPVFYVRTRDAKGKVLEKIAAPDVAAARSEADRLLGPVANLYVTGPHETLSVSADQRTAKPDASAQHED